MDYRRIEFDDYGGPDVLHLASAHTSALAADHVRVKVVAAGVQPFDAKLRRGVFAATQPPRPRMTLGNEFAGTIIVVGTQVTDFHAGDHVLGFTTPGAYSELIDVPASSITLRPAGLDPVTAAGLSGAGQTAANALDTLAVTDGDTLIIHAAAGGVGTIASQLAIQRGARVIGTASPENHAYLRSLGVEPVDYHHDLLARLRTLAPNGADASLDLIGGTTPLTLQLVNDPNRIGTTVDDAAAAAHHVHRLRGTRSASLLAQLADQAARGHLQVPINSYALVQAPEAHVVIERGHTRGKVVLTV